MTAYHDETVRLGIIERYLRHELSADEEQEWEEHYFQCEACFRALQETAFIADSVRRQWMRRGEKPASTPTRPRLRVLRSAIRKWVDRDRGWHPALAAAMVLVFVGITVVGSLMWVSRLNRQLDELRMPVGGLVSYVLEEGIRGEEPSVVVPSNVGRFVLQFNLLGGEDEPVTNTARILDRNGILVWQENDLRGQGPYGTFAIVCHRSFFDPGDYTLHVQQVRQGDGKVLSTSTFSFRVDGAATKGASR